MNPFIQIIRPSITLMTVLGVITGAVVAGSPFSISLAFAVIGAFFISAAGLVFNDYYDCETDKINAPQRPLPSGRMKMTTAAYYSALLVVLGIAFSWLASIYCLGLATANIILEFFYARNLKSVALIGNAADSWFVASTFIFGALLTLNFEVVWMLSMLAFFANMGREIFGDIEDVKGDAKTGLKTLPIVAGKRFSVLAASFFIILSVALSVLPYYFGYLGLPYLFLVFVADMLFMVSLFQSPSANQKTTKVAMIIAMFSFLAGALL